MVSILCDWPLLRCAALAFAIVSRSVADADAFEHVNLRPAGSLEACDNIFVFMEELGDTFLIPSLDLPPGLSFGVAMGLANAPWTEGRCLDGLAASV